MHVTQYILAPMETRQYLRQVPVNQDRWLVIVAEFQHKRDGNSLIQLKFNADTDVTPVILVDDNTLSLSAITKKTCQRKNNMLLKQRVAWVEGMLMEPQHFQQQERYLEHLIEMRAGSLSALAWGFPSLNIHRGLLDQDKFALIQASGVFPDGTPFQMEDHDPLPFDPGENCQGNMICLSVLMDILGNAYIDLTQKKSDSRFIAADVDIKDINQCITAEGTPQVAALQLGQLKTRLNLRSAISNAESMLPIAYIKERTRDGRVIIDDTFLPPMLDFRAIGWLENATSELLGLIAQRLESVYRPDVPLSMEGCPSCWNSCCYKPSVNIT